MTSAGVKTSFAYDLLIDDFIDSIIHPKSTFVFGCDYRVPVLHGLLDKTYINKLKTSSSLRKNLLPESMLHFGQVLQKKHGLILTN